MEKISTIVTWLQDSLNTLEMALHTKTNKGQSKEISRTKLLYVQN
jgi:hypothetical protein